MPAPRLKRVYDAAAADDGLRLLVDRLWPRGLSKANAHIDRWMKEIAPSNALRKQFHAHPEHWDAFRSAYAEELAGNPALAELRRLARAQTLTLLYAAHDTEHNNARALAEILKQKKAPAHGRG
ncbi:DUF488 domain-containing protein [Lysobacter cavernae]|uniref:DUF488 domain-containing protein n=1 Tax=Lysobacter cavernae TaxID=1685901 RepID=A0ABV7RVS7_9GAMM